MKRTFLLLALLLWCHPGEAQKISALPSASVPLSGSELGPVVQSGTTVKVPISRYVTSPGIDTLSGCSTQGSILYRNATTWVCLGPGTVGQVLQTGGGGANPSWVNGGGGGGSVSVTAATADIVITPSPGTGTFTIGTKAANRSSSSAITFTSDDFAGQVNSTGTTNTAAIPANTTLGANASILLTDQGSGIVTITDNQTVNGLALATKLHSFGFYAYTGNGSSADAFGFPGFDTITTNALPKFSDGSGATTASTVVDNGGVVIGSPTGGAQGTGTLNATGLFVNGVATSTGGTVTSVATTSPITGGTITTTGTIACASCVVASSPGLGLAHFAGSTQTVTSSLVVAADITSATITGTQIASSIALAGSPTTTTQSAKDNSTKIATTAYVDRPTGLTTGTSVSLSAPRQYFICTSTCTVTPPVPAAGYEFCALNDVGVSTVITIAAVSTVLYGKTDASAYGTATTGTMVSGGAVGDKVCLIGKDATHYNVGAFNGTWTNS